MGQAGSVTACGNTVHKEMKNKYKSSVLDGNHLESKHPPSLHHNPLYKNDDYLYHFKANIKSKKKSKKHKTITPSSELHSDDIDSDDHIIDHTLNNTVRDYQHTNTSDDHTPSNKRRIQYRERQESKPKISDNVSFIKYNDKIPLKRKQYLKYRKYKKLRSKYIKMSQLIDKLLSLNPKNLEHILMLRKTDNIDINRLTISEHLPRISRVSESLSFYAISFKPINNARKLWHVLLQDRCHTKVIISETIISSWIAQLLSAVSFLHKNNIVHLDISPQSILITAKDRLIISGFDTSMLVNDHITYNISGELLNCCWQLPSTVRRRNDFNGFELKSFDAWSIGVLTFLLLTAKFPFFKDKHSNRIPESEYVINECCISHSARDFISKLLSSSSSNRLTVHNALHHPWIRNRNIQREHMIQLDGSIYSNMFMHHEQKLNIKYHILSQQTKQYLFMSDHKKLSKKIKILNKRMLKYQEKRSDHGSDSSLFDIVTSSDDLSNDITDDIDNEDVSSSSHRSVSNTRSRNEKVLPSTYSITHRNKKKKAIQTNNSMKKRRNHSDSLRGNNKHFEVKRRNRANSQHTYAEYRATHTVNKIDVDKWRETKSDDEQIKKTSILSPLMDMTHERYPSTTNTAEFEQKHGMIMGNNVYRSPTQQQRTHHHFVRSNSNINQLTPTKRANGHQIPIYSRGSGHHTNVTTPNPTSSSTQNPTSNNRLSPNQYLNEDRFRYNLNYKIKHQHKTSSGHVIAIERSVGANSSPTHLPIINQYDMLTADPLPMQQQTKAIINIANIPRRPSLPPKIIKLESPSQTINGNVSSSSSDNNHTKDIKNITNNIRRFQITRREISPSKHRNDHVKKDSNDFVDYLSDLVSREHPINEYDPLDLNDSTLKKAIAIEAIEAIQTCTTPQRSHSPSPQTNIKYPILSEENLSLHDQHLSNVANKSGVNLLALGSNDSKDELRTTTGHTKDLSASASRLLLQNIVKNHNLRNSDSNVTSNSKAVVIAPSDADNDKNTVESVSAMDLLKAHKKRHRRRNRDVDNEDLMDFITMPTDIDATPRSSVMSLENILQERGLFKKDEVKVSRDVVLKTSNENEYNIDEHGMYAQLDARLLINNPAIQIRNVHHKKQKSAGRSGVFMLNDDDVTPPSGTDLDCKEHADIHHNIQKHIQQQQQIQETISESDVIHPATPQEIQLQQQQQEQQQLQSSLPMTSPSPLAHSKHKHYAMKSSNIHNNKRKTLSDLNANDGNMSSEDPSSISELSPHVAAAAHAAATSTGSLYTCLNNNNNNNNFVNDRNNEFDVNDDLKLCDDEWSRNDANNDGRTSTY